MHRTGMYTLKYKARGLYNNLDDHDDEEPVVVGDDDEAVVVGGDEVAVVVPRLNEDILKITILNTNTPYPSMKIRRIRACIHQRPQRKEDQYAVSREDNTPYSRYSM
ncbi:hypothetical protein Tco_1484073 [Tanacetum coccineum]